VYRVTGKLDDALVASTAALRFYRDLGQVQGEAQTLSNLGDIKLSSDRETARDHYRAALSIARQVNIPLEEARAFEGLGMSYLASNPNEGTRFLRKAMEIYRRIGSPSAERVQTALRETGPAHDLK
jgi:tetratricopeptide (TPR) repeat protein